VSVTVIGIANAIVWSGVIIFLLLRMMMQRDELDERIDRLESKIDDPGKKL
jgi:hypothetical protein